MGDTVDPLDILKFSPKNNLVTEQDSHLHKSIAHTEYFKKLSVLIAQVVPRLFEKHLSSKQYSSNEIRVKKLHSVISDLACIEDKQSLISFFEIYSQTVFYEHHKQLAKYLDTCLSADIVFATHLDTNDLIVALKKGTLMVLAELSERYCNNLKREDEFINSLKALFSGYQWVRTLKSKQRDIARYLENSKESSLSDSNRVGLAQLIGLESLQEQYIAPTLELLEYYGVIQVKTNCSQKHSTITFMAASLSLSDIIGDWHENESSTVINISDFKEVQLLCKENFYVDTSINWKSTNVVIVASKVVVKDVLGNEIVEINVSGGNGKSFKSCSRAKDGKSLSNYGPGDHGENGMNGEPGESGGNILVCADEVINSDLLSLRSVGGDGGDGQDGGNGQNGIAKPSKSDDLTDFGGYNKLVFMRLASEKNYKKIFKRNYYNVKTKHGGWLNESFYAYGESADGVQILHGLCCTHGYGFLYSRGVNGVSADGGNAGRGGKAGEGGKCGHIEIFLKNCIDQNYNHDIRVHNLDGNKGNAGKPGMYGKRDIAESRRDYLVVDCRVKPTLRYDGFIDARPFQKNIHSLPRGCYYCKSDVAKEYDSGMRSGDIQFFRVNRPDICPTKYHSRDVRDGEKQTESEEVIHSTPSKSINLAEVQMKYQLFSSNHYQIHDNSSLIQLLTEMQQNIHEQLEELEKDYIKEQYKQIQKVADSNDTYPELLPHVHTKAMSKLIRNEPQVTKSRVISEFIYKLRNNPLVSKTTISDQDLIQDIYSKVEEVIENELADQKEKIEKAQNSTFPDKDVCILVFELMEILFRPNFFAYAHFDQNQVLQSVLALVNEAEDIVSPLKFKPFLITIKSIKENIKPRYECLMLSLAHQKLLHIATYEDQAFQQKCVTVYQKICSQTTLEAIQIAFDDYFQDEQSHSKIVPFNKPLQSFETACNAALPLSSYTKRALEILMIFINEANMKSFGKFHFPNILQAIEREYAAYVRTINDPDLMFIITYLQDKLDQLLLGEHQLEELFCDELVSKVEHLWSYQEGFIFYNEESYQIQHVHYQPEHHQILIKCHSTIIRVNLQTFQATFDKNPIKSSKNILVSKVDVKSIWKEIDAALIKNDISNKAIDIAAFVDRLSLNHDQYKEDLTLLLEQHIAAQVLPFDSLSFHVPSQWVEKLILHEVYHQYGKHDPSFVTDIRNEVDGLSQCYDESLYHTLHAQFLHNNSQKCESFKIELLKVLKSMRLIFITKNFCSLVTEQGLTQAGIQDADYIFDDLLDFKMIDSLGVFFPNITEYIIEEYCKTCTIESFYLKTAFIMQKSFVQLADKELPFWNHKLGELHLRLMMLGLTGGNNDLCDVLLVHIHQMQRHYGKPEVYKFVDLLCTQHCSGISSKKLVNLFSKCSSKEWIFPIVVSQLKRCIEQGNESCSISPLPQALDLLHSYDWELHRTQQRTAGEVIDFLISNIRSQLPAQEYLIPKLDAIEQILAKIKIKEGGISPLCLKVNDKQTEFGSLKIKNYSKRHISLWAIKFKEVASAEKSLQNPCPYLTEAFAVIRRGITVFYETEKNAKGVVPRDTQMVASLLFFQSLSKQGAAQGTKLMQQISTGEGKTMILCMVAIYKALLGETIDIVTSSSVLATRDAESQKPLYDMFKIQVSHCCHDGLSERRKAYDADVIYGDIGSFQRDILETDFYDRKIRTERNNSNVFIDEVDSMLVDKGQNMLYLPHALPNLNCLDEIYLEIWSLVNAKYFFGLEQEKDQLHFALKHKLFGCIAPNAFSALTGVSEKKSEEIFEFLVKSGIINSDDHSLTTTTFSRIKYHVERYTRENSLQYEILMIIQEHIDAKPLAKKIPKQLHTFIKKSLKVWIHSAVSAKYFRPNREYIIDIDRRESACDRYPRIIIMDNETGVEQESSEWGSGLHQFLQLKHNLRLSTESLKAVYMSNISFFTKYYQNILGLTGTLGSTEEHNLFQKLYEDILIVEIPTNKPSRLRVELPQCCFTKNEWEESIFSDISEKLNNQRVVLLICEDVERARYMQQIVKCKNPSIVPELYFSSHQEKLEEKDMFQSGKLIIATNLAGRGTDIKLSNEVKKKGGLHVCLSYLPPNVRVELQAYGRAARSGEPGSCKMIFYSNERDLSYAIQKRDLLEAHRVAEIETDYFQNIQFQELLFQKFKTLYDEVRKDVKNKMEQRVKLDYCLDCWAFFLDHYTVAIEDMSKKSSSEANKEKHRILQAFHAEIQTEIEKLRDGAIENLKLPTSRLLQLGHTFMKQEVKRGNEFKDAGNKKSFDIALSLYKQAAYCNDPFALYYKAAAKLNVYFYQKNTMFDRGKKGRRELKQAFYEIIPHFQNKIRQCQAHITKLTIANRHQDQTITGNVLYFQEQKQHEIEIYSQFISNMQEVLGREITPQLFDYSEWGEEGAEVVFEIVHQEFSLKNPRIAKTCTTCPKRLNHFLSSCDSYFTYEAKIKAKIKSLTGRLVKREDFIGVIPDKEDFWNLLTKNSLITRVTTTVTPQAKDTQDITSSNNMTGFWNPKINISQLQLGSWDYIDTHSFDWIQGMDDDEKIFILSELKAKGILNRKGQLMDLNIAKPIPIFLKNSYVKHYKAIKDTLWHHTIYRFILDHLNECTEIDIENEISDSTVDHSMNEHTSVVDILTSLNPDVNDTTESNFKHIVASDSRAFKKVTLESAIPSEPQDDSINIPNLIDHVPTEDLNKNFEKLLTENYLVSTIVSGTGLNCMINAILQHAKRDYHTQNFPEAGAVRKYVKRKHLSWDLNGALHCDDKIACEILVHINDICSSEIGVVSAFVASTDGPILYGGTADKRYTSGRHVALWQQGNHFVSIVHHEEFVQSSLQLNEDKFSESIEEVTSTNLEQDIPKINTKQLKKLIQLGIVSNTAGNGKHHICKKIEEIESLLKEAEISENDRNYMCKFLTLKLEVDFKTLCNSPRVLPSNQSQVIYDELVLYAVIKEVKLKRTNKEIEDKCSSIKLADPYWYQKILNSDTHFYLNRSILNHHLKVDKTQELTDPCWYQKILNSDTLFYLNRSILNHHLKANKTQELTPQQFGRLKSFLLEVSTIDHIINCTKKGDLKTAVGIICPSTCKFLTDTQISKVKHHVLLMLQLRTHATFIISTLKNQQSTLTELETPQISLRRLEDEFEDYTQDRGDILAWFSDNQCNLIISVAEQKWSLKSIFTAVSIIVIGVAQIALGAILLVGTAGAGSFLCNGLISEGVSDMIFGIEGLVQGHCNWSQYYDHKIMSLAITVATAGIGAFLARGTEASRYAYKAFGNASKELAKSTAKQTGKSLGKVMAKQVCKKIVKTVVSATVDAGISLACEEIVHQMTQSVNDISQCIVEAFENMTSSTKFDEAVNTFFNKEDSENAGKYFHQIFDHVMQQKSFLEIWDDIESKLQTGANIATQAHANASKHLNMAGKKLKGSRIIKGIGYVSRFAPLVTESIKIGLVEKKMDIIADNLIKKLSLHQPTAHEKILLDNKTRKDIVRKEIEQMKKYMSQHISQRSKTIMSTGLQIVGQELKKHATRLGKEIVVPKIREKMDMRKLKRYQQQSASARAEENHSKVAKYELKMKRLMSRTRSPKVFAMLIEHHKAELGPAFAIPALEIKIGRPIKIVSEDGKPMLNVQEQHATGKPLEIKFIPAKEGQPGHYYVGKETFSVVEHGNDCLIHAVMKGAGISRYIASDVRKEIARSCETKGHPCNRYIRSGIAGNYVEIDLTGAGRPNWDRHLLKIFLKVYGTNIQRIPNLENCNWLNPEGTQGLRSMNLHVCHILSWKNITTLVQNSIDTKNPYYLSKLQTLWPTIEEVKSGTSVLGEGDGQISFLEAYSSNISYKEGVEEVREIVQSFSECHQMSQGDRNNFEYRLYNAPSNLRLGEATKNRQIQKAMDHNPKEERSINILKTFDGTKGFTPPKRDENGMPMTSYYVGKNPKPICNKKTGPVKQTVPLKKTSSVTKAGSEKKTDSKKTSAKKKNKNKKR